MERLAKINSGPVKQMEGRMVAEKIGAKEYVECSAITRRGVREAFEMAAKIAMRVDKRKARKRRTGCVLQ